MSKLKDKLPKEGGFTIIEVVLVLAIAGLIFLIVFLALPQLQKSRRDTQRKSDAGRVLAGIENWAGNKNGNYPGSGVVDLAWIKANVDADFRDPSGAEYVDAGPSTLPTAPGSFSYYANSSTGYKCSNTADAPEAGSGSREIAFVVKLEAGSFCQDNQ